MRIVAVMTKNPLIAAKINDYTPRDLRIHVCPDAASLPSEFYQTSNIVVWLTDNGAIVDVIKALHSSYLISTYEFEFHAPEWGPPGTVIPPTPLLREQNPGTNKKKTRVASCFGFLKQSQHQVKKYNVTVVKRMSPRGEEKLTIINTDILKLALFIEENINEELMIPHHNTLLWDLPYMLMYSIMTMESVSG